MRQRVIVVGAGVAGLTAAHELIERDFEVHVIERRHVMGGKAGSRRAGPNKDLPAEHGFRFFPSWYRHLPDTMRRIPFMGRRNLYEGKSVLDNLVAVDANLLAWYDRDPITAPMHVPRSFDQLRTFGSFFSQLQKLDLAPAELAFFFARLAQFAATPASERRVKFQNITWWQYLDADNKSRAFKDLISATTRTMVAAKATEASAYTVCRLAIRTIFDAVSNVDRILNGPTNEKWIDPWVQYLTGRGVTFHVGWEVRNISFERRTPAAVEEKPKVTALEYGRVCTDNLRRLRALLAPSAGDVTSITALERQGEGGSARAQALRARLDESLRSFGGLYRELQHELGNSKDPTEKKLTAKLVECHDLLELGQKVLKLYLAARPKPDALLREGEAANGERSVMAQVKEWNKERADLTWALASAKQNAVDEFRKKVTEKAKDVALLTPPKAKDWAQFKLDADVLFDAYPMQRFEDELRSLERALPKNPPPPEVADYYVMALPLEQIAYHINRSAAATSHDPDLERIVRLASYTDWMAGIQFYLQEKVDLGQGHIVCMDSDWGLTALEQTQFWQDAASWQNGVKSIISVDIAAWDRRGRFVNKEAFNCSDEDIAREVWEELKTSLSSENGIQRLRDSMLIGGQLTKGKSYVLDDSIVDVCDRRKQGAYEKARSVLASTLPDARTNAPGSVPYVWGPRLRFNVEPLLVNRVGSHELRPTVNTKFSNLFLASDYVETETDLACMEGANEAARRAVNALLQVSGTEAERCELWEFSIPGNLLEQITAAAKLGGVAGGAAKAAGKASDTALDMVTRAADAMRGLWERRR